MENTDKEKMLVGMYLGAIVIANLVVAKWGQDNVVDLGGRIGQLQVLFFTSLLLIGLDLTSRDFLHEMWKDNLWDNMLKLIVAGSLLSLVVNFFLKLVGWDAAPWPQHTSGERSDEARKRMSGRGGRRKG